MNSTRVNARKVRLLRFRRLCMELPNSSSVKYSNLSAGDPEPVPHGDEFFFFTGLMNRLRGWLLTLCSLHCAQNRRFARTVRRFWISCTLKMLLVLSFHFWKVMFRAL